MLILRKKINKLSKKIDELTRKMEAKNIATYVELLLDTKTLIWRNFVLGISKGIGIAIGFTILRSCINICIKASCNAEFACNRGFCKGYNRYS